MSSNLHRESSFPTGKIDTSGNSPQSRQTRRQNAALVALAVLLTAGVFAGSLMPTHYKLALHTRGRFHSWLHVLAFGALAFVGGRSVRSDPARFWVFFGSLLFGFATETLEHTMYYAPLEWRDVLVDSIGISVAMFMALLLGESGALRPLSRPARND